jgi:site-specific recombinase XerD
MFLISFEGILCFFCPKQAKASSSTSSSPVNKKSSQRSLHPIRSSIDEYILDHKSQNHSPKTIEWQNLALGNLADFLEKQEVTYVEQMERVHILSWLSALGSEPGAKGRMLSARTVNCYARSMRAFCRWLEAEGYVEAAPSNRVKMPKVGKPLIRIIEFDEFERMLKACAPPHEVGPITDCNAARNRAIFWVLWDTGIRLAELCDLRLSNFDRDKGVIIVHGKGDKERRIALGRNAFTTFRHQLPKDLLLSVERLIHSFRSLTGELTYTKQTIDESVHKLLSQNSDEDLFVGSSLLWEILYMRMMTYRDQASFPMIMINPSLPWLDFSLFYYAIEPTDVGALEDGIDYLYSLKEHIIELGGDLIVEKIELPVIPASILIEKVKNTVNTDIRLTLAIFHLINMHMEYRSNN